MSEGGCGMDVKQVWNLGYTHTERIWLVHLVVSHLAGRRSWLTLRDVSEMRGKNHHALHMNILHTICTELQHDSQPKKSTAMQSWQHLANKTLMNNICKKIQHITLWHRAETGPVMSQAPQNSLVFILPHQSRCPLSWKLQKEERKRESDTACIGIFWRMSKIKSLMAEMLHRSLSPCWIHCRNPLCTH